MKCEPNHFSGYRTSNGRAVSGLTSLMVRVVNLTVVWKAAVRRDGQFAMQGTNSLTGGTKPTNLKFPRLMKKAEVAEYLGIKLSTFDHYKRKDIIPPPLHGVKLWDRCLIDRHLDRLSGLSFGETARSALDEWRAKQDG